MRLGNIAVAWRQRSWAKAGEIGRENGVRPAPAPAGPGIAYGQRRQVQEALGLFQWMQGSSMIGTTGVPPREPFPYTYSSPYDGSVF